MDKKNERELNNALFNRVYDLMYSDSELQDLLYEAAVAITGNRIDREKLDKDDERLEIITMGEIKGAGEDPFPVPNDIAMHWMTEDSLRQSVLKFVMEKLEKEVQRGSRALKR